ncbi:MAG: site-specific integrase [Chthoniobacterales bacterium]
MNVYRDGDAGVRVMLGKKFTGTTVVKRRFPSRKAAKEFIFGPEASKLRDGTPGVVDLKRDLGSTGIDVPKGIFAEAIAASDELRKSHAPGGLLEAVRFYVKHTATAGTWTIAEAWNALERDLLRKNRDEKYRNGLGWTYGRLSEDFPKSLISGITKSEILDWLDEENFSSATRNNYIRDLKILFNFAAREKRLALNPLAEISREEVPGDEVSVLSIRDIARVLVAASHIPEMKTATALKFFAGLRTSEVQRLDWSEVKSDTIIVAAKKAKTRSRRPVSISRNLSLWLAEDARRTEAPAPTGADWRRHFALLKWLSGIDPWPRNCQRHGYGSYHLALHKNENLTAMEMGNTPDIVVRHYRAVIDSPKDVETFWNLNPGNIEDFAQLDEGFEGRLQQFLR